MIIFVRFTIIFSVLLILPLLIHAQNESKIDSLESIFSNSKSVTEQSKLLVYIFTLHKNIEQKREIIKRGQRISKENPTDSIIDINASFMKLFMIVQDSVITPSIIQKGLLLEKKSLKYDIYPLQRIRILDLVADIYQRNEQIKKSIEYTFKSIKLTENSTFETKSKKQKILALIYINLSNKLGVIKDKKALEYATKAIRILEASDIKDKKLLTGLYGNYTIALRRAGLYDSALVYAKKIEEVIPITNKSQKAKVFHLIASIYMKTEDYQNSKLYAQKALTLATENNRVFTSVLASYTLGKTYSKLKQYDSATIILEQTVKVAQKLKQIDILVNTHTELAKAYKKKSDMANAYKHLELSNIYQDSVMTKRREQETKELTVKYETEKKETAIAKLRQDAKIKDLELKNSYYFTLGAVVLGIVILIAVWIFFRQKNIIDTFEKEQAKLRWRRAQINPHFFFNVLSAIQMLVLEGEKQKVSKYITGFSYLMRQVLEGSNQEKVNVEEEIKFIKTYLDLEKLSLDFEYEINATPEDLEVEDIFIPTMLLQPFVENAIEHGLRKSTKKDKKLDILFTEINQNTLKISIKDNGAGRNDKRKSNHISRALEITQDRQKLMKNTFGYEIIDNKDENQNSLGTEVVFIIKI